MKDTEHYKEKLLKEEELLTNELSAIGRMVDEVTGVWEVSSEETMPDADDNVLADKFEDYEEKSSELKTLQPRLKDIKEALTKIEEGRYGLCETCGEGIETDRLEANPAARTCKEHM